MKIKHERLILAAFIAAIFSVFMVWSVTSLYLAEQAFLDRTASILGTAVNQSPELEYSLVMAIKANDPVRIKEGWRLLERYGYVSGRSALLSSSDYLYRIFSAVTISLAFCCVVLLIRRRRQTRQRNRLSKLTEYLTQNNLGDYCLRPTQHEDIFSPLEDELYKTVVSLREGKAQMTAVKESLADNLADIAHQLKTPLSSITLLSDLLSASLAGEEAVWAAQILSQSERMSGLVSALLALSRIDAGTLELEENYVDTVDLCACAAEVVAPLLTEKDISLQLPENSCVYTGDLEWSIQALANILKNCAEHTFSHGIITIYCVENPLYTAIVVEDNGPGISAEDLPHLFQRFYRGQNSDKNSVGIGLSLARSLIEAQNGQIVAENNPYGGARFTTKFYHPA